jgi:hypothetical protein
MSALKHCRRTSYLCHGGAWQHKYIMERDYDLFEVMPDGSLTWRGVVSGHNAAIVRLTELAAETTNEVRVIHVLTKTLIAEMNTPPRQD